MLVRVHNKISQVSSSLMLKIGPARLATIVAMGTLLGAPLCQASLDFDKEIRLQNNVTVQIVPKILDRNYGQQRSSAAKKVGKYKVLLKRKNRF